MKIFPVIEGRGIMNKHFSPPVLTELEARGGLKEFSWASCPFSFSDTQHFRILRIRNLI